MSLLFPDTSVLMNFAAINRLDLLQTYLGDHGRVVEAVSREIRKHQRQAFPNLDKVDIDAWFGEAIAITGPQASDEVEFIRKNSFGGSPNKPFLHLGESQTIYVLTRQPSYHDSIMITEDLDAHHLSKARGIVTRNTVDIFRELIARVEIDVKHAYACLHAIADSPLERGVMNLPSSTKDLAA